MGDRDNTPPLTPAARARSHGVHMTDDERASTASERRAREAARSHPFGVPIAASDHAAAAPPEVDGYGPVTSPHDLLEAELGDDDEETGRRNKSPTDAPANIRHVLNVAKHGNKHFAENKKAIARLANTILEIEQSTAPAQIAAINERIDGIDEHIHGKDGKDGILGRLAKGEGVLKTIRVVIFLLVGGSGGYGIVIAEKIWDRAEREGESTIRLQHVERQLDDLTKQLREDMNRRYPPAAERWLQPPLPQKDHTP